MIDPVEGRVRHGDGDADEEEEQDESDYSDSDADSDDTQALLPFRRIARRAKEYFYIKALVRRIGPEQPFLVSQEGRIKAIQGTLKLDLSTMIKQASNAGQGKNEVVLNASKLHDCFGHDDAEAVAALKQMRI